MAWPAPGRRVASQAEYPAATLQESLLVRVLLVAGVTGLSHLLAVLIRGMTRRFLAPRMQSEAKLLTVTGFVTSVAVFAIYFGAFGFVLSELGVSLTTYLASASVIGLAVSFGSQGVVQDVITGLTVVFSDLLDVGEMVEIGGQVGIVESVGMRFTVLINFSGARVYVPNRSIMNVINYPKGYIRAYLDAQLPADPELGEQAEARVSALARSAHGQFPGILLLPPTVEGRVETGASLRPLRVKFRIWPGQGAVIEGPVKASVVQALKQIDPTYADWMVAIHYRSEPQDADPRKQLPRPSALRPGARRP